MERNERKIRGSDPFAIRLPASPPPLEESEVPVNTDRESNPKPAEVAIVQTPPIAAGTGILKASLIAAVLEVAASDLEYAIVDPPPIADSEQSEIEGVRCVCRGIKRRLLASLPIAAQSSAADLIAPTLQGLSDIERDSTPATWSDTVARVKNVVSSLRAVTSSMPQKPSDELLAWTSGLLEVLEELTEEIPNLRIGSLVLNLS